ncbi:MAG: DUF2868 domain-containing protein [Pseudomonadota bacterium]|nr:DUF2868 domain-containing protein [Pseudomonadota bacterium]
MDEAAALQVSALRAIEMTDGARALWSDEDRAWASRTAAEVVGADAPPDLFISRRAALALDRLQRRHASLARMVRALRWRPWVGSAVVIIAFALGFFLDQVGSAQRINILAPPVLVLLVWNLALYVILGASYVVRYGEDAAPGPIRSALVRVGGGLARPPRRGAMREAMHAFFADWAQRSSPLYGARAGRILHVAAAALAVGVITGLYVRGLAFEYRASWESTFLDASTVRSMIGFAYAPGAWLSGIAIPNTEAVASIHAPANENAARWVHLMAASVLVIVVLPRLLLALLYGMVERHHAGRFPWPLDEPYFQRLLRLYRGGPAQVLVVPFSYTPAPADVAGLEALVARAFAGSAVMTLQAPVAYGDDPARHASATGLSGTTIIAVFSASATPEREVHGAFLAALGAQRARAEAVFALVDEGAWTTRWASEPARISGRRATWREMAEETGVPIVFVDLSAPDLGAVENAFEAAMAQGAR